MKILVIANEKGGVGKTAITVHLAWAAAQAGKKVLVIDLDKQKNASYTLGNFVQKELPPASSLFNDSAMALPSLEGENIVVIPADNKLADLPTGGEPLFKAFEIFKENMERLKKQASLNCDLCIIDTPPTRGAAMTIPLGVSDFVASPIEMELYSIQGYFEFLNVIKNLQKENENLKSLGMIASRLNMRDPRQKENYETILEAEKGKKTLVTFPINLRTSVGAALADKKPVWEIKTASGKISDSGRSSGKDFKNLAKNIFKEMGI